MNNTNPKTPCLAAALQKIAAKQCQQTCKHYQIITLTILTLKTYPSFPPPSHSSSLPKQIKISKNQNLQNQTKIKFKKSKTIQKSSKSFIIVNFSRSRLLCLKPPLSQFKFIQIKYNCMKKKNIITPSHRYGNGTTKETCL